MDYRKTYKTSSKVAIDKIKELEMECARLASKCGVNYSDNALELANEKIKGLDATIEHRNISLNDMRDRMFTERNKKEKLQDQLKQKNETIIHLAQVQMEMEREK